MTTPNEIALLREALKPFAALADELDRWQAKGSTSTPGMVGFAYGRCRIGLADYQAARAALAPGQHDGAAGEGPDRLIAFFNGEDHLDGYFFGDPHPKGAFWWRSYLPSLAKPAPTEQARAEGYVLVPRVPTAQMEQAGAGYIFEDGINYEARCDAAKNVFTAMLAAAGDDAVGGGA